MPRKYELGQRAATTAATRERILAATVALHAERGILATSYKDIARRADVGLGTVYHHFPTLDDLVVACGSRVIESSRPPGTEVFAGLRSKKARLERLVGEVFAWYERHPHWRRALCDADRLDVLGRAVERREGHLVELVGAAVGPEPDPGTVAAIRALIDYEVWHSLRRAGRSTEEAAGVVAGVLASGV